ncbi:MAG: YebC/PmpR family DNA-binding transcriptional regulator [Saccharofermentanales bacterium]
MSGHSKWSNIKNKKGKADAQRGSIFTKLGREIAIAVKNGGADPAGNSRLKDVISKAKAANMPNDNITRSIKKAAGSADADNYEEVRYEGYGAGGVAVIVNTLTENRNRTAGDVRHMFDKFGGNMGTTGCVSFMFEEKGTIIVSKEEYPDEDQIITDALEAGAEDVQSEEEVFEITTSPADYYGVKDALEAKGYVFLDASLGLVPNVWTTVTDEETRIRLDKMIEALEENDDIQEVYHNYDN